MKTLAETMKLYRKKSGLSLRDLAAVTGVSAATLSRVEGGNEKSDQNTVNAILSWIEGGKKMQPAVSLIERVEQLEKRIKALETKDV